MRVQTITFLQVITILTGSYTFCDGNCRQTKGSLVVLGVFDLVDSSSVKSFENAISLHNSLRHAECVPRLINKTLIVKSEISLRELMVLVDTRMQQGPCFMVYASKRYKARIVLDVATYQKINIMTAVPEDYVQSYRESVASVNQITNVETKIRALLAISQHPSLAVAKFVAITDNDHKSASFVIRLEESLRARNMEMLDWLVFTPDDSVEYIAYRFQQLHHREVAFLLAANNLTMAFKIFSGAEGRAFEDELWIVVSDLDVRTFPYQGFPPNTISLTPKNITLGSFVEDAVHSISHALVNSPDNMVKTCPNVQKMRRLLSKVAFHGSTGPVKFDNMGKRVPLRYDIWRLIPIEDGKNGFEMGYWYNEKLFITEQDEKRILKILINEYPPMVMSESMLPGETCESIWSRTKPCIKTIKTTDGPKKIKLCCYGFVIDVVGLVMNKIYDFKAELHFTMDGQYGVYNQENNSWDGVVAELLEERGDASFDLYISSRRSTVLDFTEPYVPSGIRLLVKEMERQDNDIVWLSYLRPFTSPVWLTLLGSLGVMILFLWGIDKISPVRGSKELFHKKSLFGIDNAICFALSLAFGRPADESKPTTDGARFSSVAFGMAMLVFVSTYSANLAAFLIVDDKTTPVKDIYDFKIKRPPEGFKYGTIDGSYMADYFKNSNNTYFRHVWRHMQQNNVKSLVDGVNAVSKGKLDVFIADDVSLEYKSMSKCGLKVVGEPFAMSGTSIAVKKGNPLFQQLSEALQTVRAEGLTDFIQNFWVKKYGSCTRETPPTQLKLEDLSGLFLQLTIAIVGCILGTVFHRTFYYFRKRWTYEADDLDDPSRFSQLETLV